MCGQKSQDQNLSLKIVALFGVEAAECVYGLLWTSREQPHERLKAYESKRLTGDSLGDIQAKDDLPEILRGLGDFFIIIEFSEAVSKYLRDSTSIAAISEDVTKNAFGRNRMSVRLPWRRQSADRVMRVGHNRTKQVGRRGYLIGDVTNARLKMASGFTIVEHAGLATGKGDSLLTERGDGGLPLISNTNALVGFVVGEGDNHTLIVPAENMARDHNIQFRTFPNLGPQKNAGSLRKRKAVASDTSN